MDDSDISLFIRRVRKAVKPYRTPAVTRISRGRDPFRVLVSCILSLRTRDPVTEAASARLFEFADTTEKLLSAAPQKVQEAIYPVAFYRNKTRTLRELCRALVRNFGGKVPDTIEELLTLKGVGRKTANLTVILGHAGMGICVDTHVHRISNRWGYLKTSSPEATEMVLRKKLPRRYWREYNDLLVAFGQNVCKPVSPLCSGCCVAALCKKINVGRHR